MWRKLTLLGVLLGLLVVLVLPLQAKPPQGGGGKPPTTPPSGPGLIAYCDKTQICLMNRDGTQATAVAVENRSEWASPA